MADLILRPSGRPDPKHKWALQLRSHESLGETEYYTICRVSDEVAEAIESAGAPFYLFGKPEKS